MLASFLLAAPSAWGASETDLPPALRADVSVAYEARVGWVGLEQDAADSTVEVGRRRDVAHDLTASVVFSPVEGVAVTAAVEGVPHRRTVFPEATGMLEDPVTGQGTYLGGRPIDGPRTVGSGLQGIWLGAAFQPFAERFKKAHPVTWRLDVAFRTAPPSTFWAADPDGKRGVGDGGPAFRVAGAFSRDRGTISPYMVVAWQLQTRRQVEVSLGQESAPIQINPGQSLDVRGGVEVQMSEPNQEGTAVYLDLHTGFGYRTEMRVTPGVLLPDVLPRARGTAAVAGERLGWHAGAAVDADLHRLVQLRVWSRVFWALPWRIEHPYPVRSTLDSADAGFGAELRVRIR